MPRGCMVFEGESVGESCRADRGKKAGGGTGESEQKGTTAVLHGPGDGMEESERALWQCYRHAVRYLEENPEGWRQDSQK